MNKGAVLQPNRANIVNFRDEKGAIQQVSCNHGNRLSKKCFVVMFIHDEFWLQLILAPFGHYFSTF